MDNFLKFLDILTDWPVMLVSIVIILRRQIGEMLPVVADKLADRITKFSAPGYSAEFGEVQSVLKKRIENPDLVKQIILKLSAKDLDKKNLSRRIVKDEEEAIEFDREELEGMLESLRMNLRQNN